MNSLGFQHDEDCGKDGNSRPGTMSCRRQDDMGANAGGALARQRQMERLGCHIPTKVEMSKQEEMNNTIWNALFLIIINQKYCRHFFINF
jgi:hypothetical protein